MGNSFSSFTPTATESVAFVPAGMVAKDNEEEFPDLGDSMFSSKPKAKAKAKTAVVKPVGPSAEDLKTPHKGKPSSFFNLTENTPNQDQMSWVFEFYPEYGSEPNFGPVFAAWKQSAEYTENPVPVTELMEAEIDLLELLSYKQIMSRGYACILHMHTLAVEINIKDIVKSTELDAAGQKVDKERPKYIRSFAKATVRIGFNVPVPVEKFEDMPPLGRFTLRDEGKTIALGRVVKYKPVQGAATRVA